MELIVEAFGHQAFKSETDDADFESLYSQRGFDWIGCAVRRETKSGGGPRHQERYVGGQRHEPIEDQAFLSWIERIPIRSSACARRRGQKAGGNSEPPLPMYEAIPLSPLPALARASASTHPSRLLKKILGEGSSPSPTSVLSAFSRSLYARIADLLAFEHTSPRDYAEGTTAKFLIRTRL
jgi:hypothetical protein